MQAPCDSPVPWFSTKLIVVSSRGRRVDREKGPELERGLTSRGSRTHRSPREEKSERAAVFTSRSDCFLRTRKGEADGQIDGEMGADSCVRPRLRLPAPAHLLVVNNVPNIIIGGTMRCDEGACTRVTQDKRIRNRKIQGTAGLEH